MNEFPEGIFAIKYLSPEQAKNQFDSKERRCKKCGLMTDLETIAYHSPFECYKMAEEKRKLKEEIERHP